MTRTGTSRGIRTPNDYFMDQFGSQGNRAPLLLAERNMNQMKGRIFGGDDPQALGEFNRHLQNTVARGTGEDDLFEPLRVAISVFRYINDDEALPRVQANRRAIRAATRNIANTVPDLSRLHDLLQEFDYNWYRTRTRTARLWVAQRLIDISAAYSRADSGGYTPANRAAVEAAVNSLFDDLEYMEPPPEDPYR